MTAVAPSNNPLRLYSIRDLALMADLSESTIWDFTNRHSPRFDPRAPRRIKVGRSTRFSSWACESWLLDLIEDQLDLMEDVVVEL